VEIKAGGRWRSVACLTEVVVTKALDEGPGLYCGGHPMVTADQPSGDSVPPDPQRSGGSLLGKRYTDASGTLEVLCVKAGEGTLALGEEPLALRQAKPLPSSD
jgi:hypothetical protein